jgi:hypothetical protein
VGFLSRLLGSKRSTQTTTFKQPFRIASPRIGFLNLQGGSGESLAEADRAVLAPLFRESHFSTHDVPRCDVLFLYCNVDAGGSIVGAASTVRDLIKSAGAYVAVVASANEPDSYIKAIGPRGDWNANIVLVIERKGDKFALFFRHLFEAMFNGQSMLMAWVELAPQIPGHDHPDAPSTIMAAEAGHVAFDG